MNAVQELLMRIRSTFDGSGTTAAAKAVGTDLTAANNKASEAAKKTGKDVMDAGRRGADGLNVMSVATAAMQGNFQAAASAAVPLIEKSKAAGLSLTQLSLAGAALSAVVVGLKAMSEWADAAAQRIAKIQMDNLTNKVNASAAAYDKLLESMQKVSANNDASLAYNNAMVDAYTRQALALNELAKQRELATTTDESSRREIEAKYARKGADISGMADTEKEAAERARSKERELELLQQIDESKKREKELIEEAMALSKQSQNASSTARGSIGFMGFLLGGKKATFDAYQSMAGEGMANTQATIDKAKEESSRRDQLEAARLELLRSRSVASVNSYTGAVSRDAASAADYNAGEDRSRANREAMYQAGEAFQGAASQFAPSDQTALADELKRLDNAGQLTVEAVTRMTQNLERIIKAYEGQQSMMRNIQ